MTTPYNKIDHSHCPEINSPCGIKGKHRCCLCNEPVPTPQNWREEFDSFISSLLLAQIEEIEAFVEGRQSGRGGGNTESFDSGFTKLKTDILLLLKERKEKMK